MDVLSLIKLPGNERCLKAREIKHVHGYVSGKMAIMLKKSPGSERVEYALKVPRMPSRTKEAYRASYL